VMESQSMDRVGLLSGAPDDEEAKEEGSSLRAMTSAALADPRVREMLDAFRRGGPEALASFVGRGEYAGALDGVRGASRELDLPALPPVVPATLLQTTPQRRHVKVLLGATGSVAAVKVPELAVAVLAAFPGGTTEVRVVATRTGSRFLAKAAEYDADAYGAFRAALSEGRCRVISDDDEWSAWQRLGDPVTHIALRDWADALVIAPLSANTLAKLAHGLCDDLLTCVARAWDFGGSSKKKKKPVIVAPAMNTAMWTHPFTKPQLAVCEHQLGMRVVQPVSKTLACGDEGVGALAPVSSIVHALKTELLSGDASVSSSGRPLVTAPAEVLASPESS